MKSIVLVVLLAACSKSENAPSCAEVTDHMLRIVEQQYHHGDMGGRGNREAQIAHCEQNVKPKERRCMMGAKTTEAIAQCRRESMKGSAK